MLSRFTKLFQSTIEDNFICFLGPSGAGKSTLCKYLLTRKPIITPIQSTDGIEIISIPSLVKEKIRVIDNAGESMYQQHFWETSIQLSKLVLFILDSTVHEKTHIESFKQQLYYVLDIIPEEKPIGILLNKHDLTHLVPLGKREVNELYSIEAYIKKANHIKFFEVSAKYGNGVPELITWIKNTINHNT